MHAISERKNRLLLCINSDDSDSDTLDHKKNIIEIEEPRHLNTTHQIRSTKNI